jgi:hypothetical protein
MRLFQNINGAAATLITHPKVLFACVKVGGIRATALDANVPEAGLLEAQGAIDGIP